MQFTYRNPAPVDRPAAHPAPASRSLVVGARSYRRGLPDAPVDERSGGPGRPLRLGTTTTAQLRAAASQAVADRLAGDGWRAVRGRRREQPGRPGGRLPGRARLVRQEHATCCCPATGAGSCSARCHRRAAADRRRAPVPDGCGACRRCLDGCPTGAIVAPGVVDARRCLAWLLQAPAPFPREHRVALGDRIYGCDDCQEVCPPNRRERSGRPPPGAAASSPSAAWVDLLELLDADRRRAARPLRPLVHAAARAPLPAAQRARRARQRRRPARRRACRRAALGATSPTPTRCCGPTPSGRPPPRPRRPARAAGATTRRGAEVRAAEPPRRARRLADRRRPPMRHLLVTNDFPPEARRHPVVPVGAVAAPAARRRRRCSPRPYAGARAVGRRAALPRRCARREPVLLPDAVAARRRSTGWPPRSAPSSCCSTRPCRSACSARTSSAPTASSLHGAEVTVPGRLPGSRAGSSAGCCAAPSLVIAAGGYPAAEASGPPAADLPITSSCRPGSTPTGSARSTRRPAGRRPGGASACPPTPPLVRRASAGSCPARAWTC